MAFKVEVTRKPVAGVTFEPVDEELAKYLTELVPVVLKENKDKELTITAENERDAAKYAAHAKRWGTQQTPPLYIHKLPNGKRYGPEVARLAVELESEVGPDNKPGRKAK
jgi:hypothetical protein